MRRRIARRAKDRLAIARVHVLFSSWAISARTQETMARKREQAEEDTHRQLHVLLQRARATTDKEEGGLYGDALDHYSRLKSGKGRWEQGPVYPGD